MAISLSSHVLDQQHGRPAQGIAVSLFDASGDRVATAVTDEDGRISDWPGADTLDAGAWRLRFSVGAWFAASGTATFYEDIEIAFRANEDGAHYHIPLLLSPYGYSTYRGS